MKNSGFPKLNLYVLFRDLFYNFFVILLAFLTGFIAVRTYFNFVYVPKYRSTMTVSVNVADSNVSQDISKTNFDPLFLIGTFFKTFFKAML